MVPVQHYIGFYGVGSTFCLNVTNVVNQCDELVSGVEVLVVLPPEVVISGTPTLPKGTFDPGTNIWTVGSLFAGQILQAEFCFEVVDDCVQPINIDFQISTPNSCCDDCFFLPTQCYEVIGVSCCQVAGCPAVAPGANIFNSNGAQIDPLRSWNGGGNELQIAAFDTWSNFGTTLYSIQYPTITWDATTGAYIMATSPPVDNTETQFVVRDSVTGALELRDLSSFPPSPGNNIYDIDGSLIADRIIDAASFDFTISSFTNLILSGDDVIFTTANNFAVTSGGIFNVNALGIALVSTATLALDAAAGAYSLVTAPAVAVAPIEGLVRNTATQEIETVTISHGNYANDIAAGAGAVPTGGHYFNTTTQVMHTRLT